MAEETTVIDPKEEFSEINFNQEEVGNRGFEEQDMENKPFPEEEEIEEEKESLNPDKKDEEPSSDPLEEEEEEDENVFENFSDLEKNPEGVKEDHGSYKLYAEQLGIDAKDEGDFISNLKDKINSTGNLATDNQELNGLVASMVEIHENGGDFRVISDTASKISHNDGLIEKQKGVLASINNLRVAPIDKKRNFLLEYYTSELKMDKEEALEAVEEMSTGNVQTNILQIANLKETETNNSILSLDSENQKLNTSISEASAQAAADKEAAGKAFYASVDKFNDVHKTLTTSAQAAARKAYGTKHETISMPKGLIDMFFRNEEGGIDTDVIMKNIALKVNSGTKQKYLEKLAKIKAFRKDTNYQDNQRKAAADVKNKEASDFSEGIKFLD